MNRHRWMQLDRFRELPPEFTVQQSAFGRRAPNWARSLEYPAVLLPLTESNACIQRSALLPLQSHRHLYGNLSSATHTYARAAPQYVLQPKANCRHPSRRCRCKCPHFFVLCLNRHSEQNRALSRQRSADVKFLRMTAILESHLPPSQKGYAP